jgi:hypothetical protein
MQSHASRLTAVALVLFTHAAQAEEPAVAPQAPGVAEPSQSAPPAAPAASAAPGAPSPSAPVATPSTSTALQREPALRVIPVPAIPPPPPAAFASLDVGGGAPLAGIEGGELFFRDARDRVRLYPSARLSLDLAATPGAPDLTGDPGEGALLGPSFYVRRALFEVSGEIGSRLAFTVGVELGGRRIGSPADPASSVGRVAMANAHDGRLLPADVTVSYRYRRWLNLTAGQQLLPFSSSNRTADDAHSLPERPLAIRSFAVPWHRDLGLTVWGDAAPGDYLHYELGVFGGDGYEQVFVDALPEFAGRITSRPFQGLGDGFAVSKTRIGVSARVGSRDPERVAYDLANVTTGQGWVLWQPGYVDPLGRRAHVLASGLQRAIGGELRLPVQLSGGRVLDLQAEAYHVSNDTREAVAGFLTSNTERLGRLAGVGWYGQLSFWCCGGPVRDEAIGTVRPRHVELDRRGPGAATGREIRRGLELVAIASGIHARYEAASREGEATAVTPSGDLVVYQLGGGAQYWIGRHFRGGVHYSAYLAPGAGRAENLAITPGNLPDREGVVRDSSVMHELTVRVQAGF